MQPFALHATLENIDGSIRGVELQANGAVDMAVADFEIVFAVTMDPAIAIDGLHRANLVPGLAAVVGE